MDRKGRRCAVERRGSHEEAHLCEGLGASLDAVVRLAIHGDAPAQAVTGQNTKIYRGVLIAIYTEGMRAWAWRRPSRLCT